MGTTVPSDASGSNGDLYVQYDGTTYAVIEYFVKIFNSWRKTPFNKTIPLTQAEYEQITPENGVYYIITDKQSSYQTKTDSNLQTTANTVVGAINELNSGKQDAFTMKALTAGDVFTDTTNISQFYGYQIGKVIFITRLVVTGGTVSGSEIRYGTTKSAYTPVSATRFLWDKGGSSVYVKGVLDPTNGLVIFDADNTKTNYVYSFAYYVA